MPDTLHSHHHADPRYLWVALGLIVAFMAGEVVAGIVAQSVGYRG